MYRNRIAIQKNATLLLIISDLKKKQFVFQFAKFCNFWRILRPIAMNLIAV